MRSTIHDRLTATAAGLLIALGAAAGPAAADDTEIFFGQTDTSTATHPNVLFILDTSGSMGWGDSGQVGTRMQRLQEAMNNILDASTDINIGLMGLNGTYGGGPVLYPVTPIDKIVCDGADCDEINIRATIRDAADDTEERTSNGASAANGFNLSIGGSEGPGGNDQRVGLRFAELGIPQGAQITSAVLELDAQRSDNNAAILTYAAEDVDDSAPFTSAANDLKNRSLTTATVNQPAAAWTANRTYDSADLTAVLQEVIDRPGWCGGNALSLMVDSDNSRTAKSLEHVLRDANNNVSSDAATLRIGYRLDNLLPGEGCSIRTAVAQVSHNSDDAEQKLNNGSMNLGSTDLEMPVESNRAQRVGVRFDEVPVPADADIVDAFIEFEVDSYKSGNPRISIMGEADGDPDRYAGNNWELSLRSQTSANVLWTDIDDAAVNAKVSTADIGPIVQELVDRSDWEQDNAMAFMFERNNGDSNDFREFESRNGEPAAAPKLTVRYRATVQLGDTNGLQITARQEMKEIINDLYPNHGTPLVSAHYEAAQYLLGKPVDYGLRRGSNLQWKRVSHPESYTGGQVVTPSGCTADNPNAYACRTERIVASGDGPAVYTSPLTESCQTSHVVFLSDGQASASNVKGKVQSLIGETACESNAYNEACGTDLARWLYDTDHNENIGRKQNITTHTIGFNLSDPRFMEDLASAGGGGFYTAESSSQLVSVFQDILGGVMSIDTSFTAPGATVNQFNRLTHRDDVYFALFKPTQRPTWEGNLKRYRVAKVDPNDPDSESEILGADGQPAVDPDTGFFAASAKSFWVEPDGEGGTITTPDADKVHRGGAAARLELTGIPGVGDRRVYTFIGDHGAIPSGGIDLTAGAQRLHEDNTAIDDAVLGIQNAMPSAADQTAYRRELIQWIRGVDTRDADEDGNTTEARRHMGDPMHSRPLIVNYQNAGGAYDSIVYVATNEGLLHAIDTEHGDERWAFSPQALLPNHQEFFVNSASTKHPYGLDGSMSIWRDDPNENFVVEPGEKAYLFTGMRRGGNNYYAFDITEQDSPKLAWVIEGGPGGTPGFEQLGQSWSRMTPAKMKINGNDEDVLVFGGGYDIKQDPDKDSLIASQPTDDVGRGIFIVRATTGELLWSMVGTGGASGKSQTFSAMTNAIPADVRVVDINLDGYLDQLYAADMGGQVWRFDLNQDENSSDLMQGGVIAKLNGSLARDHRRFYNEPDVALIGKGGERFLAVSIGSGWRAHPLNEVVEDRQYVLKSTAIRGAPEGYGKQDLLGNWSPITEADLIEVDGTQMDPQTNEHGWYATFPDVGEKVLGRSVIFENTVYFSTYAPDTSAAVCDTAIGGGYAYALDILDGGAVRDLSKNGSVGLEDRRIALNHGGVPPEPMILMPQDGSKPVLLFGTEKVDSGLENNTTRTYWADTGPAAALPAADDDSDSTSGD